MNKFSVHRKRSKFKTEFVDLNAEDAPRQGARIPCSCCGRTFVMQAATYTIAFTLYQNQDRAFRDICAPLCVPCADMALATGAGRDKLRRTVAANYKPILDYVGKTFAEGTGGIYGGVNHHFHGGAE